jgi:hypothetical protein
MGLTHSNLRIWVPTQLPMGKWDKPTWVPVGSVRAYRRRRQMGTGHVGLVWGACALQARRVLGRSSG